MQIHFGQECKPIKADDDPPLIYQEGHWGQISPNSPCAHPFSQRLSEGTCHLSRGGRIRVRLQTYNNNDNDNDIDITYDDVDNNGKGAMGNDVNDDGNGERCNGQQ